VDEAEVAVCGFVVSCCESAGIFEFVKAAFDHVAQGIYGRIDRELDQAVPLGRDHRDTAALFHILTNEVSIIALVGEQDFGCWSVGVHDR